MSANIQLTAKAGFDFSLEYYLSRESVETIKVYISLHSKTSHKEQLFLDTFGNNPLDFDSIPEIASWGRIMYDSLLVVSEENAIEEITALYRCAYDKIQKFL